MVNRYILSLVGSTKYTTLVDLRRYLKTLHLPSNPNIHPVHHTTSATTRALTLDSYLGNLLRQGYLDRQQVGGDASGKKGRKGGGRGRGWSRIHLHAVLVSVSLLSSAVVGGVRKVQLPRNDNDGYGAETLGGVRPACEGYCIEEQSACSPRNWA